MASPVCQAACELTKAAASGGRHAKLPGLSRGESVLTLGPLGPLFPGSEKRKLGAGRIYCV